ncbi:hypothetical protein HFP15_19070 [Amycolatopsis sp. K13G38]|uniref:Uncharacterized protein n=1 Tax=Amycolatopsis acididurans TaxID=2724524 RepID=A0ABX1J5P9_9PSEU|nr:hypothetical protein [Amycolatopsis acididurans]NKQ54989.1 hypothetical protein [Amycolatopsis acididurans]
MVCPNGHGDWFGSCGICTCRVCGAQWRPALSLIVLDLALSDGGVA